MRKNKGFTLVELMVVILIVGILAGATIPLMKGRVDGAKWAEASATAGTIRSAVRVRYAEVEDRDNAQDLIDALEGTLDTESIQNDLGFTDADLTGSYFAPGDYEITDIDEDGNAEVTVTSASGKPAGTYTMSTEGIWTKTSD